MSTSGSYDTSTGLPLGPGDNLLPSTQVWIGAGGGTGTLTANGGSFLELAQLTFGGNGIASIAGAGSELRVSGSDAYIGVGHGPQAVGTLTMSNLASLGATILGVGNFSGTGVAQLDKANVNLSGQYTGSGEYGAALVIGAEANAVGNLSAINGSTIRISNAGGSGGGLSIGGSRTQTGGDGSLTLNASSLIVDIPNNGGGSVGRSGSGLLRMQNGASLQLSGGSLTVARDPGSDGTLIATGGSVIDAGWVGARPMPAARWPGWPTAHTRA